MWIKIVLLFLFNIFKLSKATPIVNGRDVGHFVQEGQSIYATGHEKYSFMVFLKISSRDFPTDSMCGGVIISENAILTAAHCFEINPEIKHIFILAGMVYLDIKKVRPTDGQVVKVIKIVQHPGFKLKCMRAENHFQFCLNDLAIMWIKNKFGFRKTIQKANLMSSADIVDNKKGWVIGWGQNENGQSMKMLQEAVMSVISKEDCQKFNPHLEITNKVICLLSDNKNVTISKGDSGGPFIINEVVFGIASFRIKKPTDNYDLKKPVLYTKIGEYLDWIYGELNKLPQIEVNQKILKRLDRNDENDVIPYKKKV